MIDPKTDWVASDNFGVTDYIRITSNLNEVAELVGVPTVSSPPASYVLVLTASHRASIVAQYNSIVNALGWQARVFDGAYWFNALQLIEIEQLCANVLTAKDAKYRYGDQSVRGTGTVYGGGSRG